MEDELRQILIKCGRLSVEAAKVGADDNLYDAGLTSLACVNVMLAIEDTFDVEFPDQLLTRHTFQTISTLERVIVDLKSRVMAS